MNYDIEAVERSPLVLVTRVVDAVSGEPFTPSDILSIKYSVFDTSTDKAVSGFEDASIDPADALLDPPITHAVDPRWQHPDGYNFRHILPAGALAEGGKVYAVEYVLQPSGAGPPDPLAIRPKRILAVARRRT